MADLSLTLYVEKTEVVRGESIRFVATLTNRDKEPVELRSLAPANQCLTIALVDSEDRETEGYALRLDEATGEPTPPNRSPEEVVLSPGQSVQESGDVLTWIGEVAPGAYRLRAIFDQDASNLAESKEIPITVSEADPASTVVTKPAFPYARGPRTHAWVNRRGAVRDLFVLQTHPNDPSLPLLCRPVATLEADEVFPSSAIGNPPTATHLAWIADGSILKLVRLPQDAAPESPVSVPLPVEDLRLLGQPFSDRNGGLVAALGTFAGDRATLVKVRPDGTPSATAISPSPPIGAVRDVFWSREERLFLVWTGPEGKELFGATTGVEKPDDPLEGKRLFTAPQAISHLRVYQRYDERRDTYDLMCAVLCHNWVLDLFNVLRVNLGTGAVVSNEEYIADGMGELAVLESELDGDHGIAYLFRDESDRVWYGPADLAKTAPVVLVPEVPEVAPAVYLTADMSPSLVAAGRLSRSPGFYVRFIRDGRFEVRKL